MTRKDYILIAGALRRQFEHSLDVHMPTNPQAVLQVADGIACALATDNRRFNREHFIAVVRGEKSLTSHPPRHSARHCAGGGC